MLSIALCSFPFQGASLPYFPPALPFAVRLMVLCAAVVLGEGSVQMENQKRGGCEEIGHIELMPDAQIAVGASPLSGTEVGRA